MAAGDKATWFGSNQGYRVFKAAKYLVYLLLSFNIFMFLQEELLALEFTFTDAFHAGDVIQAFAATIDTTAWVILLLLFELETSVLDDASIKGVTKWLLHGIRGLCYIAIGYAFTGYISELLTLYRVVPLEVADPCSLLGQGYSLLVDIDEYLPLAADNCSTLGAAPAHISGFKIVTPAETLDAVRRLAWTDVFNSGAWILVVIVLEVEVRLQLQGKLSDRIMSGSKLVKYTLYSILFCAAFYWGYAGDFIDVWDASLWLFAFIFIELNVFEWQYETSQEEAVAA